VKTIILLFNLPIVTVSLELQAQNSAD